MREYIEAIKINPKEDENPVIRMEWDIPIDKKEKDVKTLTKEEKDKKIQDFKNKYGTGYKYKLHKCYHDGEFKPCTLEDI